MSSEPLTLQVTPEKCWDLQNCANTRLLELHPINDGISLMRRAGVASGRLALALAPHARCIWVACGPGNNGGDGFQAAAWLAERGKRVVVSTVALEGSYSADAHRALLEARGAGVEFSLGPPEGCDLGIDAMFGIGTSRPLANPYGQWAEFLNQQVPLVLALDVPSGLDADTGHVQALHVRAHHTISLLTLKPGLFTAHGRDAAGTVWFNTLGVDTALAPCAQLMGRPQTIQRPHASHKGTYGDVLVVGGAGGMTGAAMLAADAALHGGAGRVYVHLLSPLSMALDPGRAELMMRDSADLPLHSMTCVVGCGGGTAVASVLPELLRTAARIVLDADALNAVAASQELQNLLKARATLSTVLTPHPLEAARLLQCEVAEVQTNRIRSAQKLADQFAAVVVLKGSGTVIATPGGVPQINLTGNARLATAGTGDVLAGFLGALWASDRDAASASGAAVFLHGELADRWPKGGTLTAAALARALHP